MSARHCGDAVIIEGTSHQLMVRYTGERQSVNTGSGYSVHRPITYPDYYKIVREPALREGFTHTLWVELLGEWPELGHVAAKLSRGEGLDERDAEWVREVSEATGWSPEDVVDELKSIGRDPSERVERYWGLYAEYLNEAREHHGRGDLRQAGEKLYGAVLALVKYYAAVKGVPVVHWSRGKVESFITSNVEPEIRRPIRDLLDKVQPLHEHFYEGHLDERTFRERWEEALGLLETVERLIAARTKAP